MHRLVLLHFLGKRPEALQATLAGRCNFHSMACEVVALALIDHFMWWMNDLPRLDTSKELLSSDVERPDMEPLTSDESEADGSAMQVTEDDDTKNMSSESDKSVRFSDPLVTDSWDVPRKEEDDIEKLFYSAMDFAQ